MMSCKFQLGDKVRVVKIPTGSYRYTNHDNCFVGSTATIVLAKDITWERLDEVYTRLHGVNGYNVNKLPKSDVWIRQDCLEKISEPRYFSDNASVLINRACNDMVDNYQKSFYPMYVTYGDGVKLFGDYSKKSNMSLSTIAKKLIDADTRTLSKAGFVNSELNLTDEGWQELKAILFEAHKKDLVTVAQEKLDSEKK